MRMLNDRYWHGVNSPVPTGAPHSPSSPLQPPFPTHFARLPPEPPKRIGRQSAPNVMSRVSTERQGPSQSGDAINGFRRVFYEQAIGLLTAGALPIPPGHPLYDHHRSMAALEAERDILLKENADLKMRLEGKDGNSTPEDTGRMPHA